MNTLVVHKHHMRYGSFLIRWKSLLLPRLTCHDMSSIEHRWNVNPNRFRYSIASSSYSTMIQSNSNLLQEMKHDFKLESSSRDSLEATYNPTRQFVTDASIEFNVNARLHASSFPLEQASDIQWLNEKTKSILDDNEPIATDNSELEYRNAIDILSGDHAKAMKAWYSLHLPSEQAASSVENLLNHLVSVLSKQVGITDEISKEMAPGLVILHNMAIDAWSRSAIHGSAIEAETILIRMIEYESNSDKHDSVLLKHIKPDLISFNTIISAWSKTKDHFAADRAEEVFNILQCSKDKFGILPDTKTYNSLINVWSTSRNSQKALKRVEEILSIMKTSYKSGNTNAGPTRVTYNSILDVIAKSRRKDAGKRAEDILLEMEHLSSTNEFGQNLSPDKYSYSSVINAYAKCGGVGAAIRAEDLLLKMQELYEEGNDHLKPNTACFNAVINAWAYSNLQNSADKAEEILKQMIQIYEEGSKDIIPDRISFNQTMLAYSRSRRADSVEKISYVLGLMQKSFEKGNKDARPDYFPYNLLISALAKSRDYNAAQKAERILNQIEEQYESGEASFKPDKILYNSVLGLWARSSDRKAAFNAEKLVQRMERLSQSEVRSDLAPDVYTFTILIDSWAKSREDIAASKTAEILEKIEASQETKTHKVVPNTALYNAAINVFASMNTIDKKNAKVAYDILKRMKSMTARFPSVYPDIVSYNSVIKACARTGEAEMAQELLEFLESPSNGGVNPDSYTYNCVMNAWGKKTGSMEAAQNAQLLLRRMTERLKTGPDTISFNTVLNAWSNVRTSYAADRAEELLALMEKASQMNGNVKVNKKSYTSVLKCLAHSGSNDVPHKVVSILERMMDQLKSGNEDALPDVVTYNAALIAFCSTQGSSDEKRHALNLAQITFQDMQQAPNVNPDKLTFQLMFRACDELIEDRAERLPFIRNLFRQCCVEGIVNNDILNALKSRAPSIYDDEVSNRSISQLPSEWTCNSTRNWRPPKGRRNFRKYDLSNKRK